MTRRRLEIDCFTRYKNERSKRDVSPQRLVHYRGNWYPDAWCHKSEGVRMFALESIEGARLLEAKAKDVSIKQVDEETAGGYGIYRGTELQLATPVFSAQVHAGCCSVRVFGSLYVLRRSYLAHAGLFPPANGLGRCGKTAVLPISSYPSRV